MTDARRGADPENGILGALRKRNAPLCLPPALGGRLIAQRRVAAKGSGDGPAASAAAASTFGDDGVALRSFKSLEAATGAPAQRVRGPPYAAFACNQTNLRAHAKSTALVEKEEIHRAHEGTTRAGFRR
jgi:hypothetical protein